MDLMTEITIFVLAAFVGFEVISKVPTTLHTPLMSQTNAIHGIVVLGGFIVLGYADDTLEKTIGFIAVAFGTINVVGGFMVTDRMLGMFVRKPKPALEESATEPSRRGLGLRDRGLSGPRPGSAVLMTTLAALAPDSDFVRAAYIVAFVLFIVGVRQGTHPTTAKRGNMIAAAGMAVAVATTLALDGIGNWAADHRRHPGRHRRRRGRLDPGGDDRDAADGRPLQRRRRRRGGADRLVGVPRGAAPARRGLDQPRSRSRSSSRSCSRWWSARSPSGARTSPSGSSRT